MGELSTLLGLSTAATESTHGDGRDRRSVESVFETARTTARLSGRTQDTDLIAETGGVKTGQAETARNGPEETAPDCVWTADAKREARPKVRLAQLAAEVSGRRTSPSPRHRVQARSGRRGGLIERWLPGGQRVTPPRRRHLVIAAVVGGVLVSVVAVAAIVGSGPEPEHAPPLPLVQQESVSAGKAGEPDAVPDVASKATSTAAEPTSLVVSVVGTVAKPGLITVRPGARVADVIELAGGADSDTDLLTVNLARRVSDGEQIYVGVTPPPGAEHPPVAAVPADPSTSAAKVDLNTADRQLLQTLPGVGEATASRILEWRERHGRFTSVSQLREVDGIGEKRFARLRDLVSVG